MKTYWKADEIEWIFCPSEGNSGGIASMWKKTMFNMQSNVITKHRIAITRNLPLINFKCTLINVYNPCDIAGRAEVWRELIEFQKTNALPCLIT